MRFCNGTTRFVIVFAWLAVKFPKMQIWTFLELMYCAVKYYCPEKDAHNIGIVGCLFDEAILWCRPLLYESIISNWQEFIFYHRLCEPTYFSLFGLINIQRVSPDIKGFNEETFWAEMEKVDRRIEQDTHHFKYVENFSVRDGKIFMRDYGSVQTQDTILLFGDKITKHFEEVL